MARAKLLRQYLDDYRKKVVGENAAYLDRYATYQGQFDAYKAAGEAFNYMAENSPHSAQIYQDGKIYLGTGGGGFVDSKVPVIREYTRAEAEELGKNDPYRFLGIPPRPEQGTEIWDAGYGGMLSPGSPAYNEQLSIQQAAWDADKKLADMGAIKYLATDNSGMVITASAPPVAPAAPAPAADIPPPNLTQSNIRELQNPAQDMAGLQMAMNKGVVGKSELADNTQSKNSGFANPEDPNNLKDLGILARVVGGQL